MKRNQYNVGQQVVLSSFFRIYGMAGAVVTLARRNAAGAWFVHAAGRAFDELCVGTGNEFKAA